MFNLSFDRDLLLLSAASILEVRILLVFIDWTLSSVVVEPLELCSELIDSIDLFLDVPFDRFVLWAMMENYDILIKGWKV